MGAQINSWDDRIVAEFRAHGGYVEWSSEDDLAAGRPIPPRPPGFDQRQGVPIILVHHIGAKTGRQRVNPMMYQSVGNAFAVFATYGGSPRHPGWFRNLLAHPRTTVEVDGQSVPVLARVTEGAERERIWGRQVAFMPAFAEFEAAAARQIPVVVLERLQHHPRL
ncbi:nitroreductase family deazaflavin-dependent oxidoreductase [Allosaccharopolyspora coralli]|uniref:Nitroreductase family deazaflavin-dependent oxidoreductase n=1 Tax=Allosaccharopolyspora coralli TaxID=2665642 RepID=A0A5Q3Q7S9_9PSEU|nr:nitroreductase/quinone reductase family protein [Allosaccharopolyspora coralli]QGK70731.1 nitroreductase family deazaflavin-dependent oxidoreductase [Allosaccharopolyspora coralli]